MNYSSETARTALKNHFGHQDFRPGQEDIIRSIYSGVDTLAIMPTGGGKSLCFQIPALLLPGTAVVVSPLIALMHDQSESLLRARVPATYINSALSPIEIQVRLQDISSGKYKLIYAAPERLENTQFLDVLRSINISFFAVDEAHCISEWGHDFRLSYLEIPKVFRAVGRKPIIALTATATHEVREDIVQQLTMNKPAKFIHGFDRPNLIYKTEHAKEKTAKIIDIIEETGSGSTIVYCGSRKRTEEFCRQLREFKKYVLYYHGGMDDRSRSHAQDEFIQGRCKILVATNAFGMGIDKSDVRNVVHCDLPLTLEAYYQEAGRAGRDGNTSQCILLYQQSDRKLPEYFIASTYPDIDTISRVYTVLYDILQIGLGSKNTTPILLDEYQMANRAGVQAASVNSVLNLLEKNSILKRGMQQNSATVQFSANADRIKEYFQNISPEKQKVLTALLRSIPSSALSHPTSINIVEILNKHDISLVEFEQSIRAFEYARIMQYHSAGSGGGIQLVAERMDIHHLPINFSEFYKRKEFALQKLDVMQRYAETRDCKRNYILQYFGSAEALESDCGRCSSCLDSHIFIPKKKRTKKEIELMQSLLSACSETAGRYGKTTVTDIVSGKKSVKVQTHNLQYLQSFGIADSISRQEIFSMLNDMIDEGLLSVSSDRYPTLSLSADGFAAAEYILKPFVGKRKEPNAALLELLMQVRTGIAKYEQLRIEDIATNEQLRIFATIFPASLEQMQEIPSIGKMFLSKYSQPFLLAIKEFLTADEEELPTPTIAAALTPSARKTVELALQGKSLLKISEERDILPASVAAHLEEALKSGIAELQYTTLIGQKLFDDVRQYLFHNIHAPLREIRAHISEEYDYPEIRLAALFARRDLRDANHSRY